MMPEEHSQLLARAVDGSLTAEEAEQLLAACRRDPALLAKLSRLTIVERLLAHEHLYADQVAFVREVETRLGDAPATGAAAASPAPAPRPWWRSSPVWGMAAALVIGLTLWGVFRSSSPHAQIVRIESASWESGQTLPQVGEEIGSRRLVLGSGLVELKFARGAAVIVEGPADFEVRGSQHAFLHRGRAVTRLPKGTKGFVLDSPRGRLIDQGTEFGVNVTPSGDTEVHVLEGEVEAVANAQKRSLQLTVNQAARITREGIEPFAADAFGFITDLPPPASGRIGFLHWSFDEGAGEISINRGVGLGEPGARAVLRPTETGNAGPHWIAGQFGAGIYFDGNSGYVECEFPGIPGGEPRTVAFWVKVPRDSRIDEGYGIINWGTPKPGLAWQISVNPAAHEGPLGRLRLGVHEGWVVGTTDLRDDRWHHCAVVMYGGHRPDSATHILLYLDGQLEPAARKAVREIRTEIASPDAHNMWLGRNLGYRELGRPSSYGRFFRGGLDEVFVFNAALDQEQIRSLMRYGRLGGPRPTLAAAGGP